MRFIAGDRKKARFLDQKRPKYQVVIQVALSCGFVVYFLWKIEWTGLIQANTIVLLHRNTKTSENEVLGLPVCIRAHIRVYIT
jgi:hypothetical protein